MIETKVKLLCYSYMCWYYLSILDLEKEDEGQADIYLHNNTRLDMDFIHKFQSLYRIWMGVDMDAEEKGTERFENWDWISKHWEDKDLEKDYEYM